MVKKILTLSFSMLFLQGCNPLGGSETQGSFGACSDANWASSGPQSFQGFLNCLQGIAASGSASSHSISTFTFNNPRQQQWSGGVLAPNGKIYGIPTGNPTAIDPSDVLVIDPGTSSTSLLSFSNPTKTVYSSGVLAPNGKIYAIPSSQFNSAVTKVLVIDPVDSSINHLTFENLTSRTFEAGAVAPNGKIYAFSNNTNDMNGSVMIIDPSAGTVTLTPFLKDFQTNRWGGAIQASTGKILAFPNSTNNNIDGQVLELDSTNDSITKYPLPKGTGIANYGQNQVWSSAAVGLNGLIYSIPNNGYIQGGYVLMYSPTKHEFDRIFFPNPMGYNWRGSVLAPNGKIYGIPSDQNTTIKVAIVDPASSAVVLSDDVQNPTAELWKGGILAGNGRIYGIPNSGSTLSTVLVIDPQANGTFSLNAALSPYLNKY